MGLIPIYCDACERSRLVDESSISSGVVSCRDCGGAARSVPGSRYGQDDLKLYDQLAALLREAGISVANAAQLQGRLVGTADEPGARLLKLADTLPTLAGLAAIARREPHEVRKAEGMLGTLLDAIASQRRRSGLLPAVLGVSPVRQRRATKRRS